MGRRIAAVQTRKDQVPGVDWETYIVGPVVLVGDYNGAGNVANQAGTPAFDQNLGDIALDCQGSRHTEPVAGIVRVGFAVG